MIWLAVVVVLSLLPWALSRLRRASAPVDRQPVEPAPECEERERRLGRTVSTGLRAVASGHCPVAIMPIEHLSEQGVGGSCVLVVNDQVFERVIKPQLLKHFGQPDGGAGA